MKGFKFLTNFSLLLIITYIFAPLENALAIVLDVGNSFSQEDSGALIEISEVEGNGVRPALKVYLMPGESKNITKRDISAFTLSRVFGGYKEKYRIACDPNANKKTKVVISYEDILERNLPAGCTVGMQGNWTPETGNVWTKKPLKEVNYKKPLGQEEDFIIN